MKRFCFFLIFVFLLITNTVAFAQDSQTSGWRSWHSSDKQIQINYKNDWRFTQPNEVMVAKFMPVDEYPDGKFTSISLIISLSDKSVKTLEDIKTFMRGYVSNFENGKLISFESIKESNKDVLVTIISLTRNSKPTIYKSYVFLYKNKMYNLMLISSKDEFERNEVILKTMHESLVIK
ncbi:MAG: hypothetical protein Q8928_12350 [Bacteroidota bacterium]|nr:hypothetical protein [Bacteroidota bacterium]